VQQAIDSLTVSLRDRAHQFWPDSISLPDAVQLLKGRVLVALAIHHRGKLATLDRKIMEFAPTGSVEVIV
jgi:predicted nucleic acid-binding protein